MFVITPFIHATGLDHLPGSLFHCGSSQYQPPDPPVAGTGSASGDRIQSPGDPAAIQFPAPPVCQRWGGSILCLGKYGVAVVVAGVVAEVVVVVVHPEKTPMETSPFRIQC